MIVFSSNTTHFLECQHWVAGGEADQRDAKLQDRRARNLQNCNLLIPTWVVTQLVFAFFWCSLIFLQWRQHSDCTGRPLKKSAIKLIEYWMQHEVSLWRNVNQVQGISSQTCSALTYRAGEEQSMNVWKNYYGKPFISIHDGNRNSFAFPVRAWAEILGPIINHEKQITRCCRFTAPLFQFKFSKRLLVQNVALIWKNLVALIHSNSVLSPPCWAWGWCDRTKGIIH